MAVTRGLIIDEPWISKILAGDKVWEMRSKRTELRGPIALIKKGSGQVLGIANVVNVSGPYDVTSMAETELKHCISPEIYKHPDYRWWFAWELDSVQKLETPVPYTHKNGAVVWVQLDECVIEGINKALAFDSSISRSQDLRIELTNGNVNNAHFYIPRSTELFPETAWGGRNKADKGVELIFLFDGLDYQVSSDIDGSKRILRNRSAVKDFYRCHQLVAGDEIRIKALPNGVFHVQARPRANG